MYKSILVGVDNSDYSAFATQTAIAIAKKFGASLKGIHVYNAGQHEVAFRRMEVGLPPKYREGEELMRQRGIHKMLISQALRAIAESYVEAFVTQCKSTGVDAQGLVVEGKNYEELAREAHSGEYGLLVIGAKGLGETPMSAIGGVCERVARRIRKNLLVIKKGTSLERGKIVLALDGSEGSMHALEEAVNLCRAFNAELEIIHVFDPFLHKVIFPRLVSGLSSEAKSVFKFEEQEKLHDEIIDRGLKKVGGGHLNRAKEFAEQHGVRTTTALLLGKPFVKITEHLSESQVSLLVAGRFGAHFIESSDLGSNAENLLRLAPCSVLITCQAAAMPKDASEAQKKVAVEATRMRIEAVADINAAAKPLWNAEAKAKIERAPAFIRGMVIKQVERYATEMGYKEITPEVVEQAKKRFEEGIKL